MREMKDSGGQWIGEIPKTWSVSKVGMFYEVVLGKMLQSEKMLKPIFMQIIFALQMLETIL